MPKEKHFGPSPIEKIWIKEQFDKLHSEHALILKKIEEIRPDLASAILETARRVKAIDLKVPDKTVPPIP